MRRVTANSPKACVLGGVLRGAVGVHATSLGAFQGRRTGQTVTVSCGTTSVHGPRGTMRSHEHVGLFPCVLESEYCERDSIC